MRTPAVGSSGNIVLVGSTCRRPLRRRPRRRRASGRQGSDRPGQEHRSR